MVLIFDLDDTLYDERSYVESGLRAVSKFGYDDLGWDPELSFRFMIDVLENEGRGAVFDRWLISHKSYSQTLVKKCVRIYRNHKPILSLNREAKELLPMLTEYPLYLVTDGHKIVQQRKVDALSISPLFRRIFITHRFGIKNAKPSIYCFERIFKAEKCNDWSEMTYIGDNPAKDFVNLNKVGMNTIRVMTGVHKNVKAKPGYDAQHSIQELSKLLELVSRL